MRTFVFDDGQTWHMELTRVNYQAQDIVSVSAGFWAAGTPEQRVLGRLPRGGIALSDRELAEALRQALRHISAGATLDA